MSCGLGAVILVLMLVKLDKENSVLEVDLLEKDLLSLEKTRNNLLKNMFENEVRKETILHKIEETTKAIEIISKSINKSTRQIASQKNSKIKFENAIRASKTPEQPNVVEKNFNSKAEHIIGLRVKGGKIGILIDSSSSMTDEILVDVIRRKNTSATNKQAGPKWQRTKRIVEWLIARAPQKSDISIISFNDTASLLGEKVWANVSDAMSSGHLLNDLSLIVPEGSTNLRAGLEKMASLSPTDIYLITDGLPTSGGKGYKSLNPFSRCSSLWGRASSISGECRVKLFRHTVNTVKLPSVTVNVILLPIEGDPEAANEFWQWTSLTKGILINPAASWP
tara:strand:- start:2335 stop:3345 length:1011 start_codon:yes stop_codon:yes gene_type:complete